MTTAPQRSRCEGHNIQGPGIVNGVYFHSCCILNYMNITNPLSHLTVDSCRFLESLSSKNYLPVWLVSIFLLDSSQFTNHVVENRQKQLVMSSTSNIIYWDEQCRILYPSSCLFMNSFAQGGRSSITSPNICFTIPIGLWMAEPDGFYCAGIYNFVQSTVCFEKIEYQPRNLECTQISIEIQGIRILAHNEGINEVLSTRC